MRDPDITSSYHHGISTINTTVGSSDTTKLHKTLNIGDTDLPVPNVFQSSKRHTDITPEDTSERWFISVKKATKSLKNTTQRLLCSALLPLLRRYCTDQMFHLKHLKGTWLTDTLDGRTKSLDGNRYAQVFANKQYFAKIYLMDSKSKAGDALKNSVASLEFRIHSSLTVRKNKSENIPTLLNRFVNII